MSKLPTSDLESFKKQVSSPNSFVDGTQQIAQTQSKKIHKNLVISILSDYTGCGHIRNILPSTYINSVFGRGGNMQIITTPIPITEPQILKRTRSMYFQRTMGEQNVINMMYNIKKLQAEYKFKMIYDIDDFVWEGDDDGEKIPEYNFGKNTISKVISDGAIEIMKLMDTVCVSTQFLGDYLIKHGIKKEKIVVVHNTLPTFLWGDTKRQHITEPIKKPRVVWSSSPTHWHNGEKLCGDMDNAWKDWVIKSVKEDKIDYIQMGGLPWFFEEIKDKITVIDWVNSLHYPKVINSLNADIGIAPLVPNYFNYSKSAIKYQEYCMAGIVGIGTVFTNGKTSPYDVALTTANDDITVKQIDDLVFNRLVTPEVYNDIIDKQYELLQNNDWVTESAGYINLMAGLL